MNKEEKRMSKSVWEQPSPHEVPVQETLQGGVPGHEDVNCCFIQNIMHF